MQNPDSIKNLDTVKQSLCQAIKITEDKEMTRIKLIN